MEKTDRLVEMGVVNRRNCFRIEERIAETHQRVHRIIGGTFHPFVHQKIFRQKMTETVIKPAPHLPLDKQNLLYTQLFIQKSGYIAFEPIEIGFELFFVMAIIVIKGFMDVSGNSIDDGFGDDETVFDIHNRLFDRQIATDELIFWVKRPAVVAVIVKQMQRYPGTSDEIQKLGVETHLIHAIQLTGILDWDVKIPFFVDKRDGVIFAL